MSSSCGVPGCRGRTTQWGRYCPTHKALVRRHGHPEQRAITKNELRPYEKLASDRIKRNQGNALWAGIEANWKATTDYARSVLAEYKTGRCVVRHERLAAEEMVKLAEHVETQAIIVTALGMFLLEDDDPRRFRCDDAFAVQLVRRVRGLTEVNAGTWTDASTGRRKLVYRELPPRASKLLATWIIEALAGVGVIVARLERQQREQKRDRAARMEEGVRELV